MQIECSGIINGTLSIQVPVTSTYRHMLTIEYRNSIANDKGGHELLKLRHAGHPEVPSQARRMDIQQVCQPI